MALSTEEKLKDWFARRAVKLRDDQVEYIINMVKEDMRQGWWTVEKLKYDYQRGTYVPYYLEYVSPAKASRIIETPVKQVYQFNKFIVTKPTGEVIEIYTIKDDIFKLT